ncbi:MAG: arginine repressor [Lachnospiraceae bacterium]
MSKATRHEKIIELITNHNIETQSELASMLNEAGFQTTQATASRDIKELRLEKRASGNKSIYYYPENKVMNQNKYLRVFGDGFVRMDAAGNFVIIRTVSGMAMAVAAALDALGISEIVGTIAGDDTIMCATKTEVDAMNMISKIKKLLKKM